MHFQESSLYNLKNRNNNHDQSTDFFDKQKFKKSKEKLECIKLMTLENDKKCEWKTEKKWCNNFKDS